MRWQAGTATLAGAILGSMVGFFCHPVPLWVTLGLAVGVGVDSWINRQQAG